MTSKLTASLKSTGRSLLYYSRSRPRFKLHLAVDAILSGAVAFSADQLERFVKEENLVGYWVGANPDDKYT